MTLSGQRTWIMLNIFGGAAEEGHGEMRERGRRMSVRDAVIVTLQALQEVSIKLDSVWLSSW